MLKLLTSNTMRCHATGLLLLFWVAVGGLLGSCISAISVIHDLHPLLHFDAGCLDLVANCTRNSQDIASRAAHNFPREEREPTMTKSSSKANEANIDTKHLALKSPLIPTISTQATSSSFPQLLKCPHSFLFEIEALAGVIRGFQWHEIIFLHQDSQLSNQLSSQLVDAFKDKEIVIANKISLSSSITYFSILQILSKIAKTQTRIILVHVTDVTLGSRLVLAAKELGLMTKGYAWLITSRMSNMLNSMDQNSLNIMEGIVGIRPHSQISTPNSTVKCDNIPRGHSSNIMRWLSNDSQREFPMAFEVFNVLGEVERVVGYWSNPFGFSRELRAIDDLKDLNFVNIKHFKKIIWPGDSTLVPRSCDAPKAIRTGGPWRGILR